MNNAGCPTITQRNKPSGRSFRPHRHHRRDRRGTAGWREAGHDCHEHRDRGSRHIGQVLDMLNGNPRSSRNIRTRMSAISNPPATPGITASRYRTKLYPSRAGARRPAPSAGPSRGCVSNPLRNSRNFLSADKRLLHLVIATSTSCWFSDSL
jgi:hypothetical protein